MKIVVSTLLVAFAVAGFVACSSSSSTGGGTTDGGSSGSSGSSGSGGGTFSCEAKSKCPSAPALTKENIDACNQLLGGACGAEYKAYGQCALANEKCKADGTTDIEATKNACNDTYVPFSSCVTSKLADGG